MFSFQPAAPALPTPAAPAGSEAASEAVSTSESAESNGDRSRSPTTSLSRWSADKYFPTNMQPIEMK
jgi:hypothetical protein